MRKKHTRLSILFFAITTVLLSVVFMLTSTQAFADERYKGKGKIIERQRQQENDKGNQKNRVTMRREDPKPYEKQARESQKFRNEQEREAWERNRYAYNRRDYNRRSDYYKHSGYRGHPYDIHRHYTQEDYRGHRYYYQGHWRSWDQWDRYARSHPDIYRYGRYYREYGHLMFRFCDPGTGSYFFFSIGR
jgi:hypothetical protein